MKDGKRISNLEQLLKELSKAAENHDRVDIGTMLNVVGQKSFGPTLVFAGIIATSPLCSIPTMPTLMGLVVLLTTGQLLFGRKNFWLPKWLLKRKVPRAKYEKALKWMRRPARFIDRFLHPRLVILTRGAGTYVIASVCVLIGAAMMPMELIPFSVHIAGVALTAFGL